MRSEYLLLPRSHMASLIVAAIVRDTRNKPLRKEDRFNYFPASPLCAVTWVFEGQCFECGIGEISLRPTGKTLLPSPFFSGPYRQPKVSWTPSTVFAMTIGLYPDAWQLLTGHDLRETINCNYPLERVLSGELLEIFRAVSQTGSCDHRFRRLEDALQPFWAGRRGRASGAAPFWLTDWVKALSSRAAMSGAGKSVRQVQRRIKSWTGQTQQALKAHGRLEALFALTRHARGQLDLAQLSAEAGFADQSHMGREVRRITGLSPAQINRLIASDERFWCYRLLGERF